ncbi:MAG: hypothetical protein KTR32_12205 [Granulosicoccus sp.]|nr:hypothetical protein [Granulosicoccus sp.]
MSEKKLHALSPLKGLNVTEGATSITEENSSSIVSIAFTEENKQELNKQLNSQFDLEIPVPGKVSRQGNMLALLGLQGDMCFLVSSEHWLDPVSYVSSRLGQCAYYTDQSDSWAIVSIKGALCLPALQRLCPVDISPESFSSSSVARTLMEHLSVIIEQPANNHFRLYSARSSANDFAHALCTALQSVA